MRREGSLTTSFKQRARQVGWKGPLKGIVFVLLSVGTLLVLKAIVPKEWWWVDG